MSSRPRPAQRREAVAQDVGDLLGLVDGERGLHGVRDPGGVARRDPRGLGHVADDDHVLGRLADRALDLLVVGVADQEDRVVAAGVAAHLGVHLGDQRAGRVDDA